MFCIDRHLDARQSRRMATEARFLDRQDRREKEADALVGELCREGRTIFYINVRSKTGKLTGKTREFSKWSDAVGYLLRNRYV